MNTIRTQINLALDSLIEEKNGTAFQRLACQCLISRWPSLMTTAEQSDLGEDALTVIDEAADGIIRSLACSLTAEVKKVLEDARRIKANRADVQELIFATPKKVTRKMQKSWEKQIESEFGWKLIVVERSELVHMLERPESAWIRKQHLNILAEEDNSAAERRWIHIQSHAIRHIAIYFFLKDSVGFAWLMDVLDNTFLTFTRGEKPLAVGTIVTNLAAFNTRESRTGLDQPVGSFWEFHGSEQRYWCKKISPDPRSFSVVAGFDVIVPWSFIGIPQISKVEDLSLLTDFGMSIPARAYDVGIEEFILRFEGDTFQFSLELSEHGLGALHEMATIVNTVTKDDERMPMGIHFDGAHLLEMFFHQMMPGGRIRRPNHGVGMMGIAGPGGKAIWFYPTMPLDFSKSEEQKQYAFTVTVPAEFNSIAHITKLQEKIDSEPTNPEAYVELATFQSHLGRLIDSKRCLESAIKRALPNSTVHLLLAEVLMKMGRFQETQDHSLKALTLEPSSASGHHLLGISLSELGDNDAALVHFRNAASMEPQTATYQYNLCRVLIRMKKYSEAIAPAELAVRLEPDNYAWVFLLGNLHSQHGQRQDALIYLKRAIELSPDSANAHECLGCTLALSNDHEGAITSLQRAIGIEENAHRCNLLGGSLADLGRWSEAEVAFRRGVGLEPDNAGLLANLGACVANLGRNAEAVEFFRRSLCIDPNDLNAQRNLALSLREIS